MNRWSAHRKLLGMTSYTPELSSDWWNFTPVLNNTAEWLQGKYYCNFNSKGNFFDYGKLIGSAKINATLMINWKWIYDRKNRKYLYLWNYGRQHRNSNGKSGVFDHDEVEESVSRRLRQRPTTGNGDIATLAPYYHFRSSSAIAVTCRLFFRARRG